MTGHDDPGLEWELMAAILVGVKYRMEDTYDSWGLWLDAAHEEALAINAAISGPWTHEAPPVDPARVQWPVADSALVGAGVIRWTRPGSGRTWWTSAPEVRIAPSTQGPQEGVRRATWPRSPDCRDVNCHKCPGEAWDLERDEEVPCRCDCHPA